MALPAEPEMAAGKVHLDPERRTQEVEQRLIQTATD
jgi:hypothetical protein